MRAGLHARAPRSAESRAKAAYLGMATDPSERVCKPARGFQTLTPGLQTRSPGCAEPRAYGVQNREQGAEPPVWVSSAMSRVCRPRREK